MAENHAGWSPAIYWVRSLISAPAELLPTLAIPFRRPAGLLYIWLDPITSPFLAFNVK